MSLDPAQRHQIKQDAITAAWEAERLDTCDAAIALLRVQRQQIERDAVSRAALAIERRFTLDVAFALLREIADLETDGDGYVMLGADEDGRNNLMQRIDAFLADHDQ